MAGAYTLPRSFQEFLFQTFSGTSDDLSQIDEHLF